MLPPFVQYCDCGVKTVLMINILKSPRDLADHKQLPIINKKFCPKIKDYKNQKTNTGAVSP